MKHLNLSLITLAAAVTLNANGVRLPSQDALAVARGYAWTATADNPAAIYYNPAGLAQISKGEAQASLHLLQTENSYSGAAGNTKAESKTFALPSLFAAQPMTIAGQRITFGFGAHAPYGTETNWPQSGPFALVATKNNVEFLRYSVAAAATIGDNVFVGASIQYNTIDVELHRAIGIVPGDDFRYDGTSHAWSGNVGIIYRPTKNHSFGLHYQSQTNFRVGGSTLLTPFNISEAASIDWKFPENIAIGYSYRPNEAWNFEIGYDLTLWSSLGTFTLNRSTSGPLPVPFNWKNSAYYGIGATHYSGPFHYSVGINYSENSVPSEWFSPSVPDVTRVLFNAGIGYTTGHWHFESLVQLAPNTTRTISGSLQSSPYQTVDGTYRGKLRGFTLQAAYQW